MNVIRNYFLLGGIALSIFLPQLVLAADQTAAPKIDETQSHERGVKWANPNAATSAIAPVGVSGVNKADIRKGIDNITAPVKKPVQPAAKAGKQPFINAIPKKGKNLAKNSGSSAAVTASHTDKPKHVETASTGGGTNSVELVKGHNSQQADSSTVISASLDRSGSIPVYKVGDKLVVNVKANQDCNVVVFNYDSTGTLTQIFPNDYQQNGFVKQGDNVQIGGADSPFDYQIAGRGGPEKVFVYAYPASVDKNPLTVALAPISGTPFRGSEGMTVDEYRKMVNGSQVFFSRSVQVVPRKGGSQLVSSNQSAGAGSPNKIELTFTVEK